MKLLDDKRNYICLLFDELMFASLWIMLVQII